MKCMLTLESDIYQRKSKFSKMYIPLTYVIYFFYNYVYKKKINNLSANGITTIKNVLKIVYQKYL